MTPSSASQLSEVQEERQRWVEFERRDGWHSGFICGLLTGAWLVAVAAMITTVVVG